jgi:hypothetical protein
MANESVPIVVKRIKEQSFVIRENLYINEPNKILSIQIGFQLGFAIEMNFVSLIVIAYYHYPESFEPITSIQVENIFEISDLVQFKVSETEIKLPPDTISRLVDLSVNHTRSLWAKNVAGTVFQENLFPVTDLQMAKYHFPKMFEDESSPGDIDDLMNQMSRP